MKGPFKCTHVKSMRTLSEPLTATEVEAFRAQFVALLEESREIRGIVYVWRTLKDIPRLRGASPIVYIGQTKHSWYDRYIRKVEWETTNYWSRYQHIIETFGPIWIDIYETKNPKVTENRFLYQYQESNMERRPINIQAYTLSLPTT